MYSYYHTQVTYVVECGYFTDENMAFKLIPTCDGGGYNGAGCVADLVIHLDNAKLQMCEYKGGG